MKTFQDLKLAAPLEKALAAMNFTVPTPIQAEAIPVAMENRDLIGCAQTGTGKTAAFAIPMISRLLRMPAKTALILAPTRELAVQIAEVIENLTAFAPELKHVVLIGGNAMQPQIRSLQKKPRIVIATPGRLVDHLKRGTLSLSAAEVLVLDEADRMLDMGFAPQLNEIYRFVPRSRQTMMFSATLPSDIIKLAGKWLKDPVRVTIGAVSQPAKKVSNEAIQTTSQKKNDLLLDELNARQGSVLIFARTKHRTDRVARYLSEYGHPVTRIHGNRSQAQRNAAINGFRSGEFRVMVATDIAARGLDISHIAHVINYDLPQVAEDYIHRIGRTGRAGASGEAVCFVTPEDRMQWRAISRLLTN
jgi:ATP-dependent RNA helicase DeaD